MTATARADQLSAEMRNVMASKPAPRTSAVALRLAAHLRLVLPDLDPSTLGAVLLEIADFEASVAMLGADSLLADNAVILGVCGLSLYTGGTT